MGLLFTLYTYNFKQQSTQNLQAKLNQTQGKTASLISWSKWRQSTHNKEARFVTSRETFRRREITLTWHRTGRVTAPVYFRIGTELSFDRIVPLGRWTLAREEGWV